MINEAFKLVLGSICVYVLVAACSVTAQNNGERGGFAGESGRQVGESGSGNVISDVGNDILNPIPAAEAAEDGSRIVNVYQSTEDGLRTPVGVYYDKQLKTNCYFQIASDGKNRCLPLINHAGFYSNSLCSDSREVAMISKGSCAPEFIGVIVVPDNKCPLSSKVKIYNVGAKIVVPAIDFVIYYRSGDSCVSVSIPLSSYPDYDFYTVGSEIPPTNYVEGFLTHG